MIGTESVKFRLRRFDSCSDYARLRNVILSNKSFQLDCCFSLPFVIVCPFFASSASSLIFRGVLRVFRRFRGIFVGSVELSEIIGLDTVVMFFASGWQSAVCPWCREFGMIFISKFLRMWRLRNLVFAAENVDKPNITKTLRKKTKHKPLPIIIHMKTCDEELPFLDIFDDSLPKIYRSEFW